VTNLSATIIGAGIVGMSAAAFLQRSGYRVTVIDRVPPGEGCSFGNAGGIAFAEIMPTIHTKVLMKIPGWLMTRLAPSRSDGPTCRRLCRGSWRLDAMPCLTALQTLQRLVQHWRCAW
jgi:hypothetical protein